MSERETKPRSIVSIIWIGALLGPIFVMLWLGRGRLALLYLALTIAVTVLFALAEAHGIVGTAPVYLAFSMTYVTISAASMLIAIGHGLWLRSTSLNRPWYRWIASAPAVACAAVVVLAPAIRVLLYQPFDIPSQSMFPNLALGDYFLVSKLGYGYSRFSFPFGVARFNGRIWATLPDRGDLVVFRKPTDTSVDYVKRIVGLPGDRIQMINGVLNINGTAVAMEREALAPEYYAEAPYVFYRETLPGGRSYVIADSDPQGFLDNTEEFVVPGNHYFALGDNRDNSADSRVPEVGFVPFENLIGPVAFRLFNSGNLPLDNRPIESWPPASP